jgi:hypothetical protein
VSAGQRATANAARAATHKHVCAGCQNVLPAKHLRVQLSPPDQRWAALRAHDLVCLLDFLDDEENGEGVVFTNPAWIDAPGAPARA